MKRYLMITIGLACLVQIDAQDSTFLIPLKKWNLKIVGLDHMYPTYLADPLGNRFEAAAWFMQYADYDYTDEINQGGAYRGHLTIYPAIRISLLQFRPRSNPKLGIEGEMGIMTPCHMRQESNDFIGLDGVYYFAIAGNPTEWLHLRFSKHHICTHIGDEFPRRITTSVTDINPMYKQGPTMDDFRFAASVRPLWFLSRPELDILRIYAETGYFDPGGDFLGLRKTLPNAYAYMNYMGGMELEYYFSGTSKWLGGVFAAANMSAYQQNGFAKNINVTAGYILPQERNKLRLRLGFQYYNGRSLVNEFYNRKEKFIGVFFAFDV
ncbi:MAG: DUF1207 domain-containing protein [Bacteroidota bacterium]